MYAYAILNLVLLYYYCITYYCYYTASPGCSLGNSSESSLALFRIRVGVRVFGLGLGLGLGLALGLRLGLR